MLNAMCWVRARLDQTLVAVAQDFTFQTRGLMGVAVSCGLTCGEDGSPPNGYFDVFFVSFGRTTIIFAN